MQKKGFEHILEYFVSADSCLFLLLNHLILWFEYVPSTKWLSWLPQLSHGVFVSTPSFSDHHFCSILREPKMIEAPLTSAFHAWKVHRKLAAFGDPLLPENCLGKCMEMLSGDVDVSNMYGPNPDSLTNQQRGIMATHLSVWNDRTSFWEDNLFPTTLKAVRNPGPS